MIKEVKDLVPGDRFLYHSDYSGKDYWLGVTSAPFQSKQDPDDLVVFTDLIGVLSAVSLPKGSFVEVV